MNCASFEAVAGDLVRDRLPIGRERDEAFAHAEKCPRCALRLVDERALAADLRTLALGTESVEAPPRVEEALLAAWRERRVGPVAAPPPRIASGRSTWIWGAAAALLLSVGVAILRSPGKPAPPTLAPPPPAAGPTLRSPDEVATTTPLPSAPAPGHTARASTRTAAAPAASGGPAADVARSSAGVTFASLDGTGSVDGMESAHVVRVELPPSALAALGWAVADEGDASLVRADVVVAEDGVARAIRLVE